MPGLGDVKAARMVLTGAAGVIDALDQDSLTTIQAEVDQMVTAYAEAGANERTQGAVAAMAAMKASVTAADAGLWAVVEELAMLGLVVAIKALR